MAGKKTLRGDNTYMIVNDNGDNPKLGAKMLCDGRESLFLDIYLSYAMRMIGPSPETRHKKSRKEKAAKSVEKSSVERFRKLIVY